MKKSPKTRNTPSFAAPGLTTAELWDDFELFSSKMLKVVDFSRKGGIVPLNFWPAQSSLYRFLQEVQALNLFRSIRELPPAKTGGIQDAWRVIGRFDPNLPPKHVDAIRWLAEMGPRKLLRKLRENGFPEDKYPTLTCDPVRAVFGKARREGVTVELLACDYQLTSLVPHTQVAIIAHNQQAVENIFRTAKLYYTMCPESFQAFRPEERANSRTMLEFSNGSKLATFTASGRDIRSYQLDVVHLSEYAHYEDMTAIASLLTAIPPHCWVFKESTANGAQGPFYEDWKRSATPARVAQAWDDKDYEFFNSWNGYYKWFFSWLDDPRYKSDVLSWEKKEIKADLDEYEQALQKRFPKFTLERAKWRRAKIRSGECDDKDLPPEQFFAQEYPADEDEMFQTTGDQPFPAEKLNPMDQRAKANPPFLRLEVSGNGMAKVVHHTNANLLIWEEPLPGAEYVIGCDVSQGLGKKGDASYAPVFLRIDGVARRQVAAFWSKRMPAKELAHVMTTLAEWYNDAFLVVESLGPGQLVCSTIYEDNRYPFVYKRENLGQISWGGEINSFYLGYYTGADPKKALIGELVWAIRNDLIEIRDPKAIAEMRVFHRNDKGQYSAPEGENDDRVIGVALANFGDKLERGARALANGRERYRPSRFTQDIPKPAAFTHTQETQRILAAIDAMRDKVGKRGAGKKAWWLT
jgi:terminase large subunit-like protein